MARYLVIVVAFLFRLDSSLKVTMKNGRKAMKGKCPTCGTGMFRILGKV